MANPDSVMVAHTPIEPYSYQEPLDAQIEKYINIVNFHRKSSSKNKAMLSFKYDELTLKVTIIQIIIILFSTAISFIEAMKNYYALNENVFNIVIVSLSTSVALIMAIYRFLKYEEKKENVKNAIQDHVFIINKFRKIYSQIESVKEKPDYIERFNKIVDNFENETFDNYISIRENFDTIFSFRDSIYYKNKYKKNLLKLEKANNDIEMIDDYKRDNIIMKQASLLEKIFCCRSHKVDYDAFIESGKTKKNTEKEEREKKKEELEKREKENREKLLEIQNKALQNKALQNKTDNLESFLVNKNQILEDQLARLQNEFNELQKEKQNEMRRSVYACETRTVSPIPVNQQHQNVHFEPSNDNDSDITRASFSHDENDVIVSSPQISVQSVEFESKAAYELQIDNLKKKIDQITIELVRTKEVNILEKNLLHGKINSMDAERVRFERYREIMEAEMTELRRRHQDAYDRSAPAPSVDSEEKEYLKRKIENYELEFARKEALVSELKCKINRQAEEKSEIESIHRREMAAMSDYFCRLENMLKVKQSRKDEIMNFTQEKKENEKKKENEENLVISINEVDTDSDSISPSTLV